MSEDRQDITLRVRSIEIEDLNKWEPSDDEMHIKQNLNARVSRLTNGQFGFVN